MIQEDLFEAAEQRMRKRFLAGEKEEAQLIEQVARNVIVDKLVPPKAMEFFASTQLTPARKEVMLAYSGSSTMRIHRHAFNQLCAKVGFPISYANQLDVETETGWRKELLCHNLNELFHKPEWSDRSGPTRFLHRIVGDELRGFLSHRYNRHLASAPMLRTFVDNCRSAGARPIDATSTHVRISLKYLIPKVFEAFPGENVCFGTEFGNSDFGAGRLTVRSTIWRATSGTSSVLDEVFGKTHIGSVIEDSDIEMSDDTAHKEVVAQQGAIRDAVKQQLQEKTIERLLKAIRLAHEEEVPWSRLRPQLAKFLSKADQDWMESLVKGNATNIIDLPPIHRTFPDDPATPNIYWASACLGALADKSENTDRKLELQKEAGRLLEGAIRAA
jgi:hypothetical protein